VRPFTTYWRKALMQAQLTFVHCLVALSYCL